MVPPPPVALGAAGDDDTVGEFTSVEDVEEEAAVEPVGGGREVPV